jgi:hypothetical protein
MLIFVEQVSERLLYILDFAFKERGIDYRLTNDHFSFLEAEGAKFNYSERYVAGVPQLVPASVLFDEEIIIYGIDVKQFEQEACLAFNGIIDPLASMFYVLSRMEEYTTTVYDDHDRYMARNSVLFKYNWLQKVMVDRWNAALHNFLNRLGVLSEAFEPGKVRMIPTFDIDNAYAYKYKIGPRKWLATAKDFLQGNRNRLIERKLVRQDRGGDPYDSYDTIEAIVKKGFDVKMFWLLGDYAKFDKNISYRNEAHRTLIQRMGKLMEIGIHPSYKSNSYDYLIHIEKERLESILDQNVKSSRQHFLKLKLPYTYESLILNSIEVDYTMGYAEEIGFRAGTARSFNWFDLSKNRKTELIIRPFAYMDGTLNEYLNYDPETSKEQIKLLYEEVASFGGDFIFLWHNETITNYGIWMGWKSVLEYTLSLHQEHE